MESQGSGNQILMSADLALKMGVPIYGIVAFTHTAMDGEGRSVPAPGQGLLTSARQQTANSSSTDFITPLLDLSYRSTQLTCELRSFEQQQQQQQSKSLSSYLIFKNEKFSQAGLEIEKLHCKKSAQRHWGLDFYKQDPRIVPLRGALAVRGLTIDDIVVASYHGTGTKANDKNESEVLNKQMEYLGRRKGNLLPAIMQKYLTGQQRNHSLTHSLSFSFFIFM
jgi:fatty acid synthase subunit alpha